MSESSEQAAQDSDRPAPKGPQQPVFQLGLALAGAISAGAYTAGVLDFLFQALSEWDAQRGQPHVPRHRVALKVIAGASAGAITGALSAIALARGLHPREFTDEQIEDRYPDSYRTHQQYRCVLPSLHRTWVELPDMIGENGAGGFLSTGDLDAAAGGGTGAPRSLLNASLLDGIKRAAIAPADGEAATPGRQPVPYVAERLHVYLTLSNMRGIPFNVEFGRNSYGMQTMGDRAHYVLTGLGACPLGVPGSWVESDAEHSSIPISVATLPQSERDEFGEWDRYGTAALASGAFPVGLASRELRFEWTYYLRRRYPIPVPINVEIRPSFPPDAEQLSHFVFESVDGGLVNNDPFDYAQYALCNGPATGPVNGVEVDRAIIMVAPFPERPAFLPEGSPAPTVTGILRALLPALVTQARFRASELGPALDERDHGRYLIAPLRRIPRTGEDAGAREQPALERFAIACGALGGFGGFLHGPFRAHDFQLGRRNCQQFLSRSFQVSHENRIVGYPGAPREPPVIPLLGTAADPVPLPRWPRISDGAFERICKAMVARLDAMARPLLEAQSNSRGLRWALRAGWSRFLRKRTLEYLRLTMLADLIRRGQFDDHLDENPLRPSLRALLDRRSVWDVRAIVAELYHPSFDRRTAARIATATKLREGLVASTLAALSDDSIPVPLRAWSDDRGYTADTRRPGRFKQLRPVRAVRNWWSGTAVD